MLLTAGTRLGPYEIVGPLGAGGMGEVYRAKDSRLGREVAVKVLPQHLSTNPEVRTRFEREAKTVSSLNHPNICTLFDVGREGETDFLVMELVDGETLAQRIARGALPLAEVLKIGAQIAGGLDRAHRAGVIHRDLKPGNVMLTRNGAKLMDFGLARATGLAAASGSGSAMATMTHSPTMAQPLTAEGTIVGTFQYMSPEQLEGKEADSRSDLWALGCVLYEMATGRRAFEGKSQASLISAIMSGEPAPLTTLVPASSGSGGSGVSSPPPAALERVVRQCLAKDPDDRWQAAGDLKRELEWIVAQGSQSGAPRPEVPATQRTPRFAVLAWAVLVTLAATFLLYRSMARPAATGGAARLSLPLPTNLDLSSEPSDFAISPDGRRVVFATVDSAGVTHLWTRALDEAQPRPVAGSELGNGPFWSPDSRWIAFFTSGDRAQLKKVPADGGTPIALCDIEWSRGGAWNGKGDILFAPSPQGGFSRISENGGAVTVVVSPDTSRHETSFRFPSFLPDGEHFVFVAMPHGPDGYPIYVGSLHSKAVKRIGAAATGVTWVAPGYLLFQREKSLVAQRFDARGLELTGDILPVGPAPALSAIDASSTASASRNGRLLVLDSATPAKHIAVFDRTGRSLGRVPMPSGDYILAIPSPDGRSLAVTEVVDRFTSQLMRVDIARGTVTRLTDAKSENTGFTWMSSGRAVATNGTRSGSEQIYLVPADDPGAPKLVPTLPGQFKGPMGFSPDDGTMLFFVMQPGTNFDLFTRDMTTGAIHPFAGTAGGENDAILSPDGKWAVYTSDETGRNEAFVRSFPEGGSKTQITTGGCATVGWLSRGHEIAFLANDRRSLYAVPFAGVAPAAAAPHLLFRLPVACSPVGWSVSQVDDRIYVCLPDEGTPEPRLGLVMNWPALLERRK
jgi:serine/threonine protein kinase/Tol biopolymer transport system component